MKTIRLPDWLYTLADRVKWPLPPIPTLAAGFVALVLGLGLYLNCGVGGCPDVRQLVAYQPGGAPVLLDRHGERFADLAPFERAVVSLDSLPEFVPEAFIAIEDRRFPKHRGVDWVRVFGAAIANVRAGGVSQGSSTIPMQLARNVFPKELPGTSRTMKRKLQETRVARRIEARFEKHEIMEMYLNHIYFGGGAYGIEAASRLYFGKSSSKLTLAEAATLAALPKAPSHYDPRRRPERSQERRDIVLTLMEQQGYLSAENAEKARQLKVRTRTSSGRDRSGVPLGAYYIDVVRNQLEDRFGEELYRSRLRIFTGLDPSAQRAAERELEAQLKRLDGRVRKGAGPLQGAVVLMQTTGEVLALVGGRDPTTSRYNRAVLAQRQVGSTFKPFVYAAALQEGMPTSTRLLDAPYSVDLSGNDVWSPENYDGTYEGNVSMRYALVRSRNVPTVRLAESVGINDIADFARDAGVKAKMDETPALALGTVAMSPLALATAYSTFATLGTTATPRFVLRVEDEEGEVLWETEAESHETSVNASVAYIVNDMLSDAVNYGTGTGVRAAGYAGLISGKTGTTNNATDAWFVGYTPDVVGTVWIGYDTPSSLGSGATGGGYAAPVFGKVMRAYHGKTAAPQWPVPDDVTRYYVDPESGQILADGCQPVYGAADTELFMATNRPDAICPHRDWWGDFWDRVGGAIGGDNRRPDADRDERGRGDGKDAQAQRDREVEKFLRERAEAMRKEREKAQRRGRGGNQD